VNDTQIIALTSTSVQARETLFVTTPLVVWQVRLQSATVQMRMHRYTHTHTRTRQQSAPCKRFQLNIQTWARSSLLSRSHQHRFASATARSAPAARSRPHLPLSSAAPSSRAPRRQQLDLRAKRLCRARRAALRRPSLPPCCSANSHCAQRDRGDLLFHGGDSICVVWSLQLVQPG
jgi:hypothetical protein